MRLCANVLWVFVRARMSSSCLLGITCSQTFSRSTITRRLRITLRSSLPIWLKVSSRSPSLFVRRQFLVSECSVRSSHKKTSSNTRSLLNARLWHVWCQKMDRKKRKAMEMITMRPNRDRISMKKMRKTRRTMRTRKTSATLSTTQFLR